MRRNRSFGSGLTIGIVATTIISGSLAFAAVQTSASTSVLSACVDKTSGAMRMSNSCTSNETAVSWNIAGPAGATGATGAKGDRGEKGLTGPIGATGRAGNTGATGARGDRGERGLTGPIGATGKAGPTGPRGPSGGVPGASAYDLWLTAGHSGTVNDFLSSLVGPEGAQGPAGSGVQLPTVLDLRLLSESNQDLGRAERGGACVRSRSWTCYDMGSGAVISDYWGDYFRYETLDCSGGGIVEIEAYGLPEQYVMNRTWDGQAKTTFTFRAYDAGEGCTQVAPETITGYRYVTNVATPAPLGSLHYGVVTD